MKGTERIKSVMTSEGKLSTLWTVTISQNKKLHNKPKVGFTLKYKSLYFDSPEFVFFFFFFLKNIFTLCSEWEQFYSQKLSKFKRQIFFHHFKWFVISEDFSKRFLSNRFFFHHFIQLWSLIGIKRRNFSNFQSFERSLRTRDFKIVVALDVEKFFPMFPETFEFWQHPYFPTCCTITKRFVLFYSFERF